MFNSRIEQLNVRISFMGGQAGRTGAFFVASTALVLGHRRGTERALGITSLGADGRRWATNNKQINSPNLSDSAKCCGEETKEGSNTGST